LLLSGRIQILLEDPVQAFYAQKPLSHRSKDLYFIWRSLYIFWKLLLYQCDHNTDDHIGVISFQEEKISAFIVKNYRNSLIDLMGIHDNITLGGLAENFHQFHNRKASGSNNIF